MAVSLFRRWRSQTFRDLVGQESTVSTLQNVLTGGSPARAYLFCGPRGTGKTSSARIFAKAINCEKGPAAEPCNECHQCRSISDGSNLDVFEIDAASHTQVDKIRDFIVEKVHFTPVSARFKVYIIDEVHKLSTSSFNALLKTLEEPPSHVVFILATTHPHDVPATILSRCQRYDFRPLTASATEKHLLMIAEAEHLEVDGDAARQLARAADGSLRDALVLFEQAVVFSDGRVTREKVLDLLGGVGYEVLEEMFFDLNAGRTAAALHRLDDWIVRGRDLKRLAESFQEHLRIMLLLKVKSEDQSIRHLVVEERESLGRLCESMTAGGITSWLRQIMELLASLRHGHAARLEWEMLLVGLAQPEIDPSLQGLERRLEKLEGGGSLPAPVAALPSSNGAATAPVVDSRLMARLEALEESAGGHDPKVWERFSRLEAELDAWKERFANGLTAPTLKEAAPEEATPNTVSASEPTTPAPTTARSAEEQGSSRVAQAPASPDLPPRAETVSPGGSEARLHRDEVDDWLEMPPPLVNPQNFRRELSLFSSSSLDEDEGEPNAPGEDVAIEVERDVEIAIGPAGQVAVTSHVELTAEVTPAVSEAAQTAAEATQTFAETPPAPEGPPETQSRAASEKPLEAPPAPPAAVSAPPLELGDFWRRLMLGVKEQDVRLYAVLAEARLVSVEHANFHVAFHEKFQWHATKVQEGRALIETVASRLVGDRLLTLECTLGGEKASPPKDSEHDDLVARATGVFGGASIVE